MRAVLIGTGATAVMDIGLLFSSLDYKFLGPWFAAHRHGATKHQRAVYTGRFDEVAEVIAGRGCSVAALHGASEGEQFH